MLAAIVLPAAEDRAALAASALDALVAHNYRRAEDLFRQALAAGREIPEDYDGLSLALAGLGDIQGAIQAVRRAIVLNGEEPVFHYHLGLLFAQDNNHKAAIHQLEEAMRLKPEFWEAKYALSRECLTGSDFEGAVVLLRGVIQTKPNFAQARLNLALTWMQLGSEEDESIRQLRVAAVIEPQNAQVHLALGELYGAKEQQERAIEEFQHSLQIDPDNPEGHYNLALVFRLSGKPERAEAELVRTLELDPSHALAHKALGLVYREQNKLQAARDQLLLSTQYGPEDADARHLLGSILLKLDDAAGAVPQLREAVRLDPFLVPAYYNLAAAFAKLGNRTEASAARAGAESSREAKARANMSTILLKKAKELRSNGDFAGAIAALRQAIRLSPDFTDVIFQLVELLNGKANMVRESETLLRHALSIQPHRAQGYLYLGTLLIASKRESEGVAVLIRGLDIAPSLTRAHYELGKVYFKERRFFEATDEFGVVLAWQPDNADASAERQNALEQSSRNH